VNKLTAAVIVGFCCGILAMVTDISARYLKLDIFPFTLGVMVLIALLIGREVKKER
jgi:hypothetical protein